jgi:hypothetical protein
MDARRTFNGIVVRSSRLANFFDAPCDSRSNDVGKSVISVNLPGFCEKKRGPVALKHGSITIQIHAIVPVLRRFGRPKQWLGQA